ncbi:uncharacterized protein LOC120354122 [Nilaparvata lugens]|uniref:uncharacterized protein LOC120354122 n=1 Tax=Nilaparvata lugens TaxID=108931 RepID=UPI00193E26C4|nr:uncharacterized protein LOC120354122 [Nilaparvata lugens]
MDPYEVEEERIRVMFDIPSSELGDPLSDFSDIEDEQLIINAAEIRVSEEIFEDNSPVEVDPPEINANEELSPNIPGPSHHASPEPMDLSMNQPDAVEQHSRKRKKKSQPKQPKALTNPTYKGRNKPNPTIWSNTPQSTAGKPRKKNLIPQLPGPIGQAKQAKSETECWSLFFPDTVIEKLFYYTNIKIQISKVVIMTRSSWIDCVN